MKILLTGKNGQVGFELRRSLAVLGEVLAVGSAECDFEDVAAVRRLVQVQRPDVIVNPAAFTAVDRAEANRALAQAINATAPAAMAEEAQRLGALLVHFSTDYVFDGTKQGAYVETDEPNPLGAYGATKWAGERAIAAGCERHLILRTSWVVGAHGANFAKTMLRLAAERESLSVVSDQFGAPTSAALLADLTAHVVRQLAGARGNVAYGVYHAVASGVTSWHEYACHVIERARAAGRPVRVPPGAVKAIGTADYATPARRPANSRLDTSRLRAAFGLHLPAWQDGVNHVLEEIFQAAP
jgi:dTDP-4-dehydrorhamnose reductase